MSIWEEEFSKTWAVSPRIMSLVQQGVLEETSWRQDVSPSFGARLKNGRLLRLWVEHPNPHRRESGSPYRYLLTVQKDFGDPIDFVIVETNNIDLALSQLVERLEQEGQGPKWRLVE